MRFARPNHTAFVLCTLSVLLVTSPDTLSAAGVTLITHGNNSSTAKWVTGMANALSARLGGNTPIYRIDVAGDLSTSVTKISGGNPLISTNGELVVMLDWGPVSANSTTTFDVADVVSPLFGQTNLIGELGGHALAEFPIHILGHSRGASLVCELSKRLGAEGLWVDHMTGWDSYPLGSDAPSLSYENVLFADSYHQTSGLLKGSIVPGSAWRRQTDVSGGYNGFFINGHSDIHLWYHGGIDLGTPTTNGDFEGSNPVTITSSMRNDWWTIVEEKGTNAGFIYSRVGGGDRLSTVQPNGADSTPIRDGFNRYFDIGGGAGPNNRTAVGSNSGDWPNPIRFDLLSTNQVQQGDTATFGIHFQWAQPVTNTQVVQVFADIDRNPLNGNEILLEDGSASGTTMAQVGHGTIDVDLDGALLGAGDYEMLVKMTAAGRSRYLYASQRIELAAATQPFTLDISRNTSSIVTLGINGTPGQTTVLERSVDGSPWLPIATNTLSSARWEVGEPVDPDAVLTLFRAVLPSP